MVVVTTVVYAVPAIVMGLLGASPPRLRGMAAAWARVLLRAGGVRVVVHLAAPPPAGPAVYAANHGSALDIPILFAHLPADFRIIHKRSLYLVPLVGQYLWVAGHIGIHRRNAFRARRDLQRAARRIHDGTSVAVFPEGTRSRDGSVGRFKRGSFALAVSAGVPVVPVSLAGIRDLAPHGALSLRPGTVVMTLHEAVPTEGLSADDADALAARVRAKVAAGCGSAA